MATTRAVPTMPSSKRAFGETLAMECPKWHTLMLTLTQTANEIRKVSVPIDDQRRGWNCRLLLEAGAQWPGRSLHRCLEPRTAARRALRRRRSRARLWALGRTLTESCCAHEPGVLLGGPRDCVRVHEECGEEGNCAGDLDADDRERVEVAHRLVEADHEHVQTEEDSTGHPAWTHERNGASVYVESARRPELFWGASPPRGVRAP